MITSSRIEKDVNLFAMWLKRWKRDPVAYVIECIGDTPTYQQVKILRALVKYHFVAVRSGHGIGKSRLMAWVINWYLDTHRENGVLCRIPVTGASADQLGDIVWPEVSGVMERKWGIMGKAYEGTSDTFYLKSSPNGCFASLRTARAEKPDALQGFHNCFFALDEGSGIPDSVFEVARGAMGDEGSYGLMTGNPTTNSGYFYNVFNSNQSTWKTLHFSSMDSMSDTEYSYLYIDPYGRALRITHKGRQTRKWVDDMRNEFGENSNVFKIRVMGEFATGAADLVISENLLKNVFTTPDVQNSDKRIVLGLDPARSGNDDTALCIRQGNRILALQSWHGEDTVESRHRTEIAYREYNCTDAYIDTIGIGSGVYDEMKHSGLYNVHEVIASAKSPEDNDARCKCLRDWLWWSARSYFRRTDIHFCIEKESAIARQFIRELTTPTYCFKQDKVVVESKEELKKRGVQSPNLADAFLHTLMCYDKRGAFPNIPKIKRVKKNNNRSWKTI